VGAALAGAVGVVDGLGLGVAGGLGVVGLAGIVGVAVMVEVAGELVGHVPVAAIGRPDCGVGHDLGIRIGGDVALVAIETPRRSLVAVPCITVNRGDDPVFGDLTDDLERAVIALFEVLADHQSDQLGRLDHLRGQLPSLEHGQQRQPVGREPIDHRGPRPGVVPITDRLARTRVVVLA
jgi:hypothetical protein